MLALTLDLATELFGPLEVSCETNPNHLTDERLAVLSPRVHRLSVGVQSFDDGLLAAASAAREQQGGESALLLLLLLLLPLLLPLDH